jgi:flagellar motility protein MotE (MotC chaperone)
MKLKIVIIFLIIAGFSLSGKSDNYIEATLAPSMAYAQVKQLDEASEKDREKKMFPLEKQEEVIKEKEKLHLPGQMPAVSPETFRMIETIENKNRELKKREEELRLKEARLEALEVKIRKDLDKIEQSISESKNQMGFQDEKTKQNVEALIKVYSSMKPEEAANLVEAIDESLALKLISGMKSKIAAQVLSNLDVKVAKRISEKLAGKDVSKAPTDPGAAGN